MNSQKSQLLWTLCDCTDGTLMACFGDGNIELSVSFPDADAAETFALELLAISKKRHGLVLVDGGPQRPS